MSSPQTDHRRAHLRFEVLGRMSGSLLSIETLRVLNLGSSGALVEAALPLPANAEYRMQLVVDTHVSEATVKIRRIAEVRADSGPLRYRIGLEFLAITPEAIDVINRIVMESQAQV